MKCSTPPPRTHPRRLPSPRSPCPPAASRDPAFPRESTGMPVEPKSPPQLIRPKTHRTQRSARPVLETQDPGPRRSESTQMLSSVQRNPSPPRQPVRPPIPTLPSCRSPNSRAEATQKPARAPPHCPPEATLPQRPGKEPAAETHAAYPTSPYQSPPGGRTSVQESCKNTRPVTGFGYRGVFGVQRCQVLTEPQNEPIVTNSLSRSDSKSTRSRSKSARGFLSTRHSLRREVRRRTC
jgi:hypothetical protein